MAYVVEGRKATQEELLEESWQSPGLRAQEKRRAALRLAAAAAATPNDASASSPSSARPPKQTKASPPSLRRHVPLPRLPADTIHIVGRPKAPVDLTKSQPWHLYTALLQAANLQDLPPASRDMVRIHPTNNTFTLSVAESARAQAYLRITSLTVSGKAFAVHIYAPPPDDALRGILYHAFDDFTDQAILEDLQASNPTLSVVNGRRMGKTPHILVTLIDTKLPRWICYHGVQLRLLPFHNKVEACFNCRSTGHRTDVCPKPRQDRCQRCGGDHPPPPEGSTPTCTPHCIICNGQHSTYSSNCKYRFVKKRKNPSANNATSKHTAGQARVSLTSANSITTSTPTSTNTGSQQSGCGNRSISKDRSISFPPLPNTGDGGGDRHQAHASRSRSRSRDSRRSSRSPSERRSRSRSARRRRSRSTGRPATTTQPQSSSSQQQPKRVAWDQGPPGSTKPTGPPAAASTDPQVRELAKENALLKSNITSLQSQIARLTGYIQTLETKVNNAMSPTSPSFNAPPYPDAN